MASYELFKLWCDLLEFCQQAEQIKKTQEFKKEFKSKQDYIVRLYKRMTNAEQGEYHRLVNEFNRS